jgi:arylsulfatase A-like enzyme
MNFYEEVINIPFIVSWKGHTHAGIVDRETLVSNGIDIYPTICRLAGVKWPETLPGTDLTAASLKNLKEHPTPRQYVVSEINQNARSESGRRVLKGRMVVSRDYKYIVFDGGENREMFFDLVKDPGEMHSLVNDKKYEKQMAIHRHYLEDWISRTSDDFLSEK